MLHEYVKTKKSHFKKYLKTFLRGEEVVKLDHQKEVFLHEPLTKEELAGAYKVLAYLAPNSENLLSIIKANEQIKWLPQGAFMNLLSFPEVRNALAFPEIQKSSLPFKFQLDHGSYIFGYAWDHFVTLPAYRSKHYEPEIQNIIRKYVAPGDVAIDIGANIGCHTSLMCELSGKDGQVYSFEPVPHIFKLLELMKQENSYSWLTLHNIALTDEESTLSMELHSSNLGGNSIVGKSEGEHDSSHTIIRGQPLDVVCSTVSKASIIKLDVEGYESHVISGGMNFIRRCMPAIIMEFAPTVIREKGRDPVQLLQTLMDVGYSINVVGKPGFFSSPEQLVNDLQSRMMYVDLELVPNRKN